MIVIENLHRINDWSILRVGTVLTSQYFFTKLIDNTDFIQYIPNTEKDWNATVWGAGKFNKKINKRFDDVGLIPYTNSGSSTTFTSKLYSLYLKQGYNFTDIFGILIVIRSLNTNRILKSQIYFESDFHISSDRILQHGSWWPTEVQFYLPDFEEPLSIDVVEIPYNSIINNYTINDYPNDLIPLIETKPLPTSIQNKVWFDNGYFLNIELISTNSNKTVLQTILDYFDTSEYSNISVSHLIRTEDGTEIRLINENDMFAPIRIGFDLTKFGKTDVICISSISVDNKLMERSQIVSIDQPQLIGETILKQIKPPVTVYPVEVKKEIVVNQQVIKTDTSREVVTVYQPIYAEMINDNILIANNNKNVIFNTLSVPAYLVINKTKSTPEQVIYSKQLQDSKQYFDLSELTPITENTTYKLYSVIENKLIGSGNVVI